MNKDLNKSLSFPGQFTLLTLTNNLRILLGCSKPETFKNIEAEQKVWDSYKKCVKGKG